MGGWVLLFPMQSPYHPYNLPFAVWILAQQSNHRNSNNKIYKSSNTNRSNSSWSNEATSNLSGRRPWRSPDTKEAEPGGVEGWRFVLMKTFFGVT